MYKSVLCTGSHALNPLSEPKRVHRQLLRCFWRNIEMLAMPCHAMPDNFVQLLRVHRVLWALARWAADRRQPEFCYTTCNTSQTFTHSRRSRKLTRQEPKDESENLPRMISTRSRWVGVIGWSWIVNVSGKLLQGMRRLKGGLQLCRQLGQAAQHRPLGQARQCHGHALKVCCMLEVRLGFRPLVLKLLGSSLTLCPGVGKGNGRKCCFWTGSDLLEVGLANIQGAYVECITWSRVVEWGCCQKGRVGEKIIHSSYTCVEWFCRQGCLLLPPGGRTACMRPLGGRGDAHRQVLPLGPDGEPLLGIDLDGMVWNLLF